ncbi:MAG: YkgJ family cysteine cluster protein [Proteobacteria bacterium]|nr:YkgJ family cysteine cluster protein [Pseudomonadota bacterium]MBU1709359.1 YkgJ family cysteine cluster protein [Pseudomonadota bacterium]
MAQQEKAEKNFPQGMVPLGKNTFQFACNPDVPCFTACCRKLDLYLYPYDIIRLKNRLQISSEDFLNRYTGVVQGANPFFPALMLQMSDTLERTCPFLDKSGCTVYEDRPSACRTYPLERAVDRTPSDGRPEEFFFLTNHEYCKGHEQETQWSVKEWIRDQKLQYYNVMDDLWAEMDTLFSTNPWAGEGAAGPKQLMAFMVCYNIDRFRQYVNDHDLLKRFRLDKSRRRLIETDDEALLRFGFDWLKLILAKQPTLIPR